MSEEFITSEHREPGPTLVCVMCGKDVVVEAIPDGAPISEARRGRRGPGDVQRVPATERVTARARATRERAPGAARREPPLD